ncbi:MAG: hypothetical protein H8E13_04155, partial [Actinobacteria bacterium]|nr:hypothetical protein [Actinomycetota bacterium]
MIEKKLIRFDGGMNDKSIVKPDNQPDTIVNYENINEGELTRRRKPYPFDNNKFSEALDNDFNSASVENIVCWYPSNLPASQSSSYDYLMVAYGASSGNKNLKLYLYYGGQWQSASNAGNGTDYLEDLNTAGIIYNADSELSFFQGTDKLLIVDGENVSHFIEIDNDNIITAGSLGIPAPRAKIYIEPMTDWDETLFEDADETDSMADCGLFQYCYTVETEEGDESNPSPISDTHDLQWNLLNASSLVAERWVAKIELTNLKIPENLDKSVRDSLKHFNIYRMEKMYSADLGAATFVKSMTVEIYAKYDTNGDPIANSFTDSYVLGAGAQLSYENDIAPKAKDVCEIGGTTILGNIETRVKFPFDFQYYCPITISNQDARSYTDAIIKLRVYDEDANAASDPVDNLDWSDWDTGSGSNYYLQASASACIRFYDTDLTTPLSTCYLDNDSLNEGHFDFYIKVPSLLATQSKKIYLCWTNDTTSASGVNNSDYISASYGKFIRITDDWSSQNIFTANTTVPTESTYVCSPMEMNKVSTGIENKANTDIMGEFENGMSWKTTTFNTIPDL